MWKHCHLLMAPMWKLPLADGYNLETLPVSDGFNLETLPLSDGFNLETLPVSDGFKLETLLVSDGFKLCYSVEGTKTPELLKNVRLRLGPFKISQNL